MPHLYRFIDFEKYKEGYDVPNLDYIIYLSRSNYPIEQRIGRILRTSVEKQNAVPSKVYLHSRI